MMGDPYDAAVAELKRITGTDLSKFPYVMSDLKGAVFVHDRFQCPPISNPPVVQNADGIVRDIRSIARRLSFFRLAIWGTARSDADRRARYVALHERIVDTLLPGQGLAWGESGYQHPTPGELKRRADAIEQYMARLNLAELPSTTRPRNAAFEQLIVELAGIYSETTGLAPTAANATDPGFHSPFVRLVRAIWPAISDYPPSAKTIAAVLRVVPISPAAS